MALKGDLNPNDIDDSLQLGSIPEAMLYGVRWNDNPPFVLRETKLEMCNGKYISLPYESLCWYYIFVDGEKRSKGEKKSKLMKLVFNKENKEPEFLDRNSKAVIMLRSHFGDLQFLHSMASRRDEIAYETREKILMWIEFMWKVSTGEISRGQDITKTGIKGLDLYFWQGDTVQKIMIPNRPKYQDEIDFVALGSLLHIVHDSFTKSHTERDVSNGESCGPGFPDTPGKIIRFLNYSLQNSNNHSDQDTREAVNIHILSDLPNMVSITRTLIAMQRERRSWKEMEPYFQAIFSLADPAAVTSSGGFE